MPAVPDASTMPVVRFEEAITFLRRRLDVTSDEWDELIRATDSSARERANAMSEALIRDILEAVLKAVEDGTAIQAFRDAFGGLIRDHGWEPDAGENAWHSDLIFRRLTMEAYAAGRWEQIQRLKTRRPYLRYVTAGDKRVRPAHAAWHDTILPVDDPWWLTHFPPNGWNCRCHVQSLSDRDLVRYGLTVSAEAPIIELVTRRVRTPSGYVLVEVPAGIDPGFGVNVGVVGLGMWPAA